MLWYEVLIAFLIALVFYILGRRDGKKTSTETQNLLKQRTSEAIDAISKMEKSIDPSINRIKNTLENTQSTIREIPETASEMKKDSTELKNQSSKFVQKFNSLCNNLDNSIDDLESFASTIRLLEEKGFELVVESGDHDDRKKIGKLPSKIFILFPKRTIMDRLFDAASIGGASALAKSVAEKLSGGITNEQIYSRLDDIENRLRNDLY